MCAINHIIISIIVLHREKLKTILNLAPATKMEYKPFQVWPYILLYPRTSLGFTSWSCNIYLLIRKVFMTVARFEMLRRFLLSPKVRVIMDTDNLDMLQHLMGDIIMERNNQLWHYKYMRQFSMLCVSEIFLDMYVLWISNTCIL